jgi:hypothetical protein
MRRCADVLGQLAQQGVWEPPRAKERYAVYENCGTNPRTARPECTTPLVQGARLVGPLRSLPRVCDGRQTTAVLKGVPGGRAAAATSFPAARAGARRYLPCWAAQGRLIGFVRMVRGSPFLQAEQPAAANASIVRILVRTTSFALRKGQPICSTRRTQRQLFSQALSRRPLQEVAGPDPRYSRTRPTCRQRCFRHQTAGARVETDGGSVGERKRSMRSGLTAAAWFQ